MKRFTIIPMLMVLLVMVACARTTQLDLAMSEPEISSETVPAKATDNQPDAVGVTYTESGNSALLLHHGDLKWKTMIMTNTYPKDFWSVGQPYRRIVVSA